MRVETLCTVNKSTLQYSSGVSVSRGLRSKIVITSHAEINTEVKVATGIRVPKSQLRRTATFICRASVAFDNETGYVDIAKIGNGINCPFMPACDEVKER